MLSTTASRLSAALLGYVTLIILLVTLNPFYFSLPEQFQISFTTTWGDIVANLVLFIPIGFLFRLTGGTRRGALIMGAGISLIIEGVQFFMPARTTSFIDFLCNILGSGVGAVIHDWSIVRVAISSGMIGRLRLETPLMGLTYLMLPLLWINRLALNVSPYRWVLTVLLGICRAIIFADLSRHWVKGRWQQATFAALTTGLWFLLGSIPRPLHPFPAVAIGVGVMFLATLLTLVPSSSTERRFERQTLRQLLPFFIFYVLLAALWPPFRPLESWHGMFGFTTRLADNSLQGLYPRVEYLTAFVVLGYILAEWRGRRELPLRRDLPRLIAIATGGALTLEILSGFQAGLGASAIRGILAIPSAVFGGIIYHLLRDHIRFLLGRSSVVVPPERP